MTPYIAFLPSSAASGRKAYAAITATKKRMFATRSEAQEYLDRLASPKLVDHHQLDTIKALGVPFEELMDLALWLKLNGVQWGKVKEYILRGRGGYKPQTGASEPDLMALHHQHLSTSGHLRDVTLTTRSNLLNRLHKRSPALFVRPAITLSKGDVVASLAPFVDTPTSHNNILKELRALFNWAINQELLTKNPALLIKPLRVSEATISALKAPALEHLIRACRAPGPDEKKLTSVIYRAIFVDINPCDHTQHDYNMLMTDTTDMLYPLLLMAFAGVRPHEVDKLTWADINLEERVITIPARAAKTGGTRHITMRANLAAWLEDAPIIAKNNSIAPRGYAKKWKALRYRAGYKKGGKSWQSDVLRHSFATMSLKSGITLNELQLDMGHHDLYLLRTRYLNMRGISRADAAAYWAIEPLKAL